MVEVYVRGRSGLEIFRDTIDPTRERCMSPRSFSPSLTLPASSGMMLHSVNQRGAHHKYPSTFNALNVLGYLW